jgi:hypothetical protein
MVANSVFLRFSEVPERTQGVRLPFSWQGTAHRWVMVVEGPTGAPLEVGFQPFLALKNPNFRPFGSRKASETVEERLEKRPSFGQGHGQRFC